MISDAETWQNTDNITVERSKVQKIGLCSGSRSLPCGFNGIKNIKKCITKIREKTTKNWWGKPVIRWITLYLHTHSSYRARLSRSRVEYINNTVLEPWTDDTAVRNIVLFSTLTLLLLSLSRDVRGPMFVFVPEISTSPPTIPRIPAVRSVSVKRTCSSWIPAPSELL